jgi:type I restriction enzyme S subunit
MINTILTPLRAVSSLITKGTTPKTLGRSYTAEGIPFLRGEDIQGAAINVPNVKLFIDNDTNGILSRSVIHPGDLLITIAGTVGRCGYVGLDAPLMNCNQAVAIIRLDYSKVDPEYACFACQSPSVLATLKRQGTTATITNLSLQQIGDLVIPLPPLSEQRRIVDILNHAASIRRLREEARAKVREIIPALFVEMFGDPATNPKGWPVFPLGDVAARLEGGKNLLAGDDNPNRGGLRILKVSAVTSGAFRVSESKPAPNGYAPPPSHFVRQGDLLFSRANTVDLVGATAFVYEQPHNVLLPDKLWRFVWKVSSSVLPFYMLHLLQQKHTRAVMSRMATGTSDSMKNISQGKLRTLPTMVPPLELQQEFTERVSETEAVFSLNERASQTAEQLTHSLLAQVFGSPERSEAPAGELAEAVL